MPQAPKRAEEQRKIVDELLKFKGKSIYVPTNTDFFACGALKRIKK